MAVVGTKVWEQLMSIVKDDVEGFAMVVVLEVRDDDEDKQEGVEKMMMEVASWLSSAAHQAVPYSRHSWPCSVLQTLS